jgi:putative transport protein
MDKLLENNPLLLLFLVAAIGYLIGTVKIKGASLGTAAVLFVGLLFGTFNPDYNVPQIVFQLGLIFFVYSIGLSSGPAFFQSFKRNGYRDIGFILLMLFISAAFAVGMHLIFGFDKATTVGIYSGSTTNTTALAGVTDLINRSQGNINEQIQKLVVGYTYSYPMGVLGVMVVLKYCEKWLKVDYENEKTIMRKQQYPVDEVLSSAAVQITNEAIDGHQLRDVFAQLDMALAYGRILKNGRVTIASWDTLLNKGDILMVIGSIHDIDKAVNFMGMPSDENILDNYKEYEVKRIFVSNVDVVGKNLSSLNLSEKFDAVITRIRRGDTDMLATADTALEIGDRIRFVARKKDLKALSAFFGDSYYESSKVNLFSFGLGIALGLIIGTIEFSLPGDINFKLGFAGGPLLVGLVMGFLRRTGPIVWTLPYSSNVTLRQIGLILLLAVIGLQSGHSFIESLSQIGGLAIFMGGVLQSMVTAFISVFIGYKLFKIPFSMLLGFMSNQPAILDYTSNMSKNKVPQIGYAIMFPISLIMKILYAQILYLILS